MTDAKKRRVSKTPSPIPTLNLRELAAGSSRKLIIALPNAKLTCDGAAVPRNEHFPRAAGNAPG